VQQYLIAQGVLANRLRTVSYGKERPLAVCSDEACYSQNRRAVTVISAGTGA
jgi:peptidoglycan-associated lipoprotein